MPFTDEQRQKASETRQRMAEARRMPQTPPSVEPVSDGQPSDTEVLKQLLSVLKTESDEKDTLLEQVDALLGKLRAKDYPGLADHPVVQQFIELMSRKRAASHREDPPGTIYNRGALNQTKKPWTMRDAERAFPPVEFTPGESVAVFYQGIPWQFHEDRTVMVPACFVGIYLEARKAGRLAREHAEWLFGKRDTLSDPTLASAEGARLRAVTAAGKDKGGGWYEPGGGMVNMAGAQPAEGEGAGAEGE